jgi:hypothetical protein
MTQKFPYTISHSNITVFVSGQIVKMPSTHMGFKALAEHLQGKTHDAETILQLADKRAALSRLTAGKVQVIGTTVYYAGVPVKSALAARLVQLVDMGHDATPWALFMDKIEQNPSEGSKARLFEYIEAWDTPLSPDGDFIAFKGVREDYMDIHSGTFDNSPGKVVEQDRDKCVEDPNVHCAAGLHACASHYLDGFWGRLSRRVIAVKINPRDVVSVPYDYKLSKMRLCRYEVIGDIEDEGHRARIERAQIVTVNEDGNVVEEKISDREVLIIATDLNPETFEFRGDTYIEVPDTDCDQGDTVVNNENGKVGKVLEYETIRYYDEEHPEYEQWRDGDVAGSDIKSALMVVLEYEDGEEETVTWYEDQSQWPLTTLEPYDDDEDDLIDEMDEDDDLSPTGGMNEDASYREPVILTQAMRVEEPAPEDMLTFEHVQSGRSFAANNLVTSVAELGQRGFSRKYNVPRTTVQDWVRRAQDAGY